MAKNGIYLQQMPFVDDNGMSDVEEEWNPWNGARTNMDEIPDFDIIRRMKDEEELMTYMKKYDKTKEGNNRL